MIPTYSYPLILAKLSSDFEYWTREYKDLKVTMVGVLFARPQTELAKREIFPEINYFNQRLGRKLHIFTAGCLLSSERIFPDQRRIGHGWAYSDEAFDSLRRSVESETTWKYEDGVELLLLNATRNTRTGTATLDFHSAINVDLLKARQLGYLDSIAKLIGRLANFCDTYAGEDPTWGFGEKLTQDSAHSALWNAFISALPKDIRGDTETARSFMTKDLSKRRPAGGPP